MSKPSLMDRTRAAVAFVNRASNDRGTEVSAFLDLFHPDMPEDKKRELVRDAREQQRSKRGG